MIQRRISRMQRSTLVIATSALVLSVAWVFSQGDIVDPTKAGLPNPNPKVIKGWGTLADGRSWGSTAGVDIGPDGQVWAYDRCGAYALAGGCDTSEVAPVLKFDRETGKVLASFGEGLFVLPHGIHVDRDGNVWVTDSQRNEAGTKGLQVFKFSPQGEVLLTLGKAGVSGAGPDVFQGPCDVITAPNGDIFVSDGHDGQNAEPPPGATGRIMKFSQDGTFIKEWGKIGTAPGEFRTPHALAFDSQGRLFVADRGNHRIQIFDQDGNHLATWKQFGRPSGLYIDSNDVLYSADSESNDRRNPGVKRGIYIGNAITGEVTAFIPDTADANSGSTAGTSGAEGVAVDANGAIYGAEVGPRTVRKYVRR